MADGAFVAFRPVVRVAGGGVPQPAPGEAPPAGMIANPLRPTL
jgi:hypothetical protein